MVSVVRRVVPAALVVFAVVGAAPPASAGPISALYLSTSSSAITVVQGDAVVDSWARRAYSEFALSVNGDVRTNASCPTCGAGSQYTLDGTFTGVSYAYPAGVGPDADDGTTDGYFNYLVSYGDGYVYRTSRDFSSASRLFSVGAGWLGITYDDTNQSLWVSQWNGSLVRNYSMAGLLLGSFSTGHSSNGALALDHADDTLWLVNNTGAGVLEQYSKTGARLGTGLAVGYTLGGEFDLGKTIVPEPSTLAMLGTAIAGLLARSRRAGRRF